MSEKLTALLWRLPEWMHVLVWALTHWVIEEVSWAGIVLEYRWSRRESLH